MKTFTVSSDVSVDCTGSRDKLSVFACWLVDLYSMLYEYPDKVMAQPCNQAAGSDGIALLGPNSETKGLSLVTSTNL